MCCSFYGPRKIALRSGFTPVFMISMRVWLFLLNRCLLFQLFEPVEDDVYFSGRFRGRLSIRCLARLNHQKTITVWIDVPGIHNDRHKVVGCRKIITSKKHPGRFQPESDEIPACSYFFSRYFSNQPIISDTARSASLLKKPCSASGTVMNLDSTPAAFRAEYIDFP